MSVKVICGYDDPEFPQYEKLFYDNFNSDDWDHILIGEKNYRVQSIADRLAICDYELKEIEGIWYAVTYHS